MMQGLDQSKHDCWFCANAAIVVLVTQLGRAVAIDDDGEDTIGAMVQTWSAGDQNPHGGEVLVNVDRKARGLPSSRQNFVEKLPKISHVWCGASWVRDALSIIALLSLLSWSSLVWFLQDYFIPDTLGKCATLIAMLMRMRCPRAFESWSLTCEQRMLTWARKPHEHNDDRCKYSIEKAFACANDAHVGHTDRSFSRLIRTLPKCDWICDWKCDWKCVWKCV